MDAIARTFVMHHQIVNAIAHCQGGDEFAKQHNGLSMGIRKNCVPFFNERDENGNRASGVEVIQSEEGAINTTGMKHNQPTNLPGLECLSLQELSFLDEAFEGENPGVTDAIDAHIEAVNPHLEETEGEGDSGSDSDEAEAEAEAAAPLSEGSAEAVEAVEASGAMVADSTADDATGISAAAPLLSS